MVSIARRYFSPIAAEKPSVGDTKTSLVEVDHLGWLKCDGRSLNVADYYFLYQLIGNTYGGNSRTFNLPNPAGQVIGIIGTGAGLTTRAYGASVGEETHTLTIPEMPTHNHTGTTNSATTGVTDSGHAHSYTTTNNDNVTKITTNIISGPSANSGTSGATTGTSNAVISDPGHTHTFTTNNTGGGNAHNNMQPTLFVGNLFIFSGKIEKTKFPLMVSKLY
jgi:microcystin-dependent protein